VTWAFLIVRPYSPVSREARSATVTPPAWISPISESEIFPSGRTKTV
jgi:hypothetical protein